MQDPTKFTQVGTFGFENMPSGNPGLHSDANDDGLVIAIVPCAVVASVVKMCQVENPATRLSKVIFSGVNPTIGRYNESGVKICCLCRAL
jgi:hypothetical protein